MMYDAKNRLPKPGKDVLAVVDLGDSTEVCQAVRTHDNFWYIYKYGKNVWNDWKVLEWMPMPKEDGFGGRFVAFGLGYALGVVLAFATVLVAWC